jgi:hypothetical protein
MYIYIFLNYLKKYEDFNINFIIFCQLYIVFQYESNKRLKIDYNYIYVYLDKNRCINYYAK